MKTLIDRDSELFKEFFRGCSIVMSAPNVAFLVGEHAVLRGVPAVVFAMPTRVYVGLKRKRASDPAICAMVLDNNDQLREVRIREDRPVGTAHVRAFAAVHWRDRTGYLDHMLDTIDKLQIRVLSDIEPGSGADWSGAFSSALAACVHFGVFLEEPDEGQIESEVERWSRQDGWKSSETFSDVNLLAFFLESAFHHGMASGYGTYVSLLGGATPTVYKTCCRKLNERPYINVYSGGVRPLDSGDGTTRVIERLTEIANSVVLRRLPSDLSYLLYVAVVDTDTRKEIGTGGAIKQVLNELTSDLQSAREQVPISLDMGGIPSLQVDSIWSALDYFILAFIHFYDNSLREGPQTTQLPKVLGYMNSVGHMLLALGLGWKELVDVITRISAIDETDESNTAVKLSGGGLAGVCTIASTVVRYDGLKSLFGENRILYSSDRNTQIPGLCLHALEAE